MNGICRTSLLAGVCNANSLLLDLQTNLKQAFNCELYYLKILSSEIGFVPSTLDNYAPSVTTKRVIYDLIYNMVKEVKIKMLNTL